MRRISFVRCRAHHHPCCTFPIATSDKETKNAPTQANHMHLPHSLFQRQHTVIHTHTHTRHARSTHLDVSSVCPTITLTEDQVRGCGRDYFIQSTSNISLYIYSPDIYTTTRLSVSYERKIGTWLRNMNTFDYMFTRPFYFRLLISVPFSDWSRSADRASTSGRQPKSANPSATTQNSLKRLWAGHS